MTLTNRLTLYAVAALACVLAGFSGTLYGLARWHLHHQADERLDAALNTLAAAAEVGPGGIEWEPRERVLSVGVPWAITDPAGTVVAHSAHADAAALAGQPDQPRHFDRAGEPWQLARRQLHAPDGPSPPPNPKDVKYPAIVLTAALSLEPAAALLRQLALALAGVSAVVLILALIGGRALCRRALRPVRLMAEDARAMNPAEPGLRLQPPASRDELADLGASFNGLLDRLHEALARQQRFTGDAAHQLRTPLVAVLGQVEVALRRERPAEEYRRVLTTVQTRAQGLHRIIEALLFLARADAEASAPARAPLDLAAWLTEHLAGWADHPRFADIRPELHPLSATSHPVLLGELLNVLLDNACRYSRPGTPITIRLDPAGALEVRDQGSGIAPADLPHVFDPFFRATSSLQAHRDGVGLGLSVANRLAAALGCTLRVTSEPGHGSCFRVELPGATGDHPL